MEIVLSTEYLDIYRLSHGVLLKVYKCCRMQHVSGRFNKRKCNKIADYIYQTKEDIELFSMTMPSGSIVVEGMWVEKISNPDDYRYELKTTGDALSGNAVQINKYLDIIDMIIARYKND